MIAAYQCSAHKYHDGRCIHCGASEPRSEPVEAFDLADDSFDDEESAPPASAPAPEACIVCGDIGTCSVRSGVVFCDADAYRGNIANRHGVHGVYLHNASGPCECGTEHAPPLPPVWETLVRTAPIEWFTVKPPSRTWLLRDGRTGRGLLPLGRVGQIIAEGGAGKSWAAFQFAIAVATGTPWLGTFDVMRPGRVLIIAGEEDDDECWRRLYKSRHAARTSPPPEGAIVVLPLAGVPCPMLERGEDRNVAEAPFLRWLREYVAAHGPWDLIIVDPLSRFAGPDAEIDNATATRFIQSLESIATLTGATVLVAHHTNKLGRMGGRVEAVAGRGSSALVDGVRWQCSLGSERLALDDSDTRKRLGELVTWSHTKSNYSVRADELLLRRDLDNGGALVPLDATDLDTVQAARGRDLGSEAKRQAKEAHRDARKDVEDATVLRVVRERPGISTRDLATAVQAGAECGRERAYVAVQRVIDADRVKAVPGPRKAQLHYLADESHA